METDMDFTNIDIHQLLEIPLGADDNLVMASLPENSNTNELPMETQELAANTQNTTVDFTNFNIHQLHGIPLGADDNFDSITKELPMETQELGANNTQNTTVDDIPPPKKLKSSPRRVEYIPHSAIHK